VRPTMLAHALAQTRPHASIPPEVFEPVWRPRRVDGRAGDRPVTETALDRPDVAAATAGRCVTATIAAQPRKQRHNGRECKAASSPASFAAASRAAISSAVDLSTSPMSRSHRSRSKSARCITAPASTLVALVYPAQRTNANTLPRSLARRPAPLAILRMRWSRPDDTNSI
jgi:hypothetical protein